jgi:hyperosmotically inducible protein
LFPCRFFLAKKRSDSHLSSGGNFMNTDEERVQKHVVVSTPGQRSEVLTERTETRPREASNSGAIILVAVIALVAVGVIVYLVTNRNANEEANRNANLAAAGQTNSSQPPTTIIQQPAQQAPVIVQQPAPAQQAPIIIQQPADATQRANTSANDDANMQDIATKRLAQEPDMSAVVMTITDARVSLTGTVKSEAAKAKAEQLVKGVKGIKSVDNKLVIAG